MLIAIRERAKGWLAWLIVGAIALTFTVTGVYSYVSGPPASEVAEVAGVPITRDAVERLYQQQRRQLEQLFGGQLDPRLFDDRQLRREALQNLIDQALLRHYVAKQGFRISDATLAEYIRSQPFFQVDGRFSSEQYHALLRSEGLTPEAFEARLRVEQMLAQAQQGLYESAFVTEPEVKRLLELQWQQRELAYLTVPVTAFADEIEIPDDEVRAYYERNQDLFLRPEQLRLAYLELAPEVLAAEVAIDDDEVRRRYEEIKDVRYRSGGQRQVRHILLTVPAGADAQEDERIRQRLEEMRQQILAGEATFEELAQAHSEDPGAARTGGNLGLVGPGDMVPEFEQAAFALQQGELSEPVRTEFGWHLIEVTAIEPEQVLPFAEVEAELRQELIDQQVARLVMERANRLADLAYEHPDELETAAEALGLEIRQTDWFGREGAEDGFAANPEVVRAAFSEDVLVLQRNSQLLELGPNHYAVVRLLEHQSAEPRPFEEVQAEARQQLERQRMAEQAQALGTELLAKARAGEPLEALAEDGKVQLAQPGFVGRDAEEVPVAVLRTAFQLPKPDEGETSVGSTLLGDGSYVVVVVSGVRTADVDEEQARQEAEQVASQLRVVEGESALRGLMALLRAQGDVKIHEDRL